MAIDGKKSINYNVIELSTKKLIKQTQSRRELKKLLTALNNNKTRYRVNITT